MHTPLGRLDRFRGLPRTSKVTVSAAVAIGLVGTALFYLYRYYGPTPWRIVRLYVQAVNANDFDAQYALFAPGELKNPRAIPLPLLPKDEFRDWLGAAAPPSPNGLKLGVIGTPLTPFRDDDVINGMMVPIRETGRPAVPSGPKTREYCVALQKTPQGWRIRPVMTYWVNYSRFYGPATAWRLQEDYLRRIQRLGFSAGSGNEQRNP
jgi:hypothetical protein